MNGHNAHDGFTDAYIKALAKQLDGEARELQRQAARKQSAADACRKELRRRARMAKAGTPRPEPRATL